MQNIADCRLDLDEQQFNLLDYLKTDNCSQSVELILGNEVDAIAEGLLKDAEEIKEDSIAAVQDQTSLKCTICLETFDLDCDLQTHMIAHPENDKAICTLCKKQFKDLKVLKRHVRIHLKKKPYEVNRMNKCVHVCKPFFQCNICNRPFSESGSLTRHLRKHRGEIRHLCSVCGKGFYEANVLMVHMRTHTGEKPIACGLCEKRFSDPNGLRSHMRSHTGERKHFCNICNKSFSHSFVLKKHLRVHSGEKPYSCSVCGKRFTQVTKRFLICVFNAALN